MFFALREIAGWLLSLFGVYLIWMGVSLLQAYEVEPRMIEGSAICAAGVMVLRFGIHLIRVSTAARIVLAPRGAVSENRQDETVGSATN